MMRKIGVLLLLSAGVLGADELPSIFGERAGELIFDPAAQIELAELVQAVEEGSAAAPELKAGAKSPGKAFLLSALVPGLGEYYGGAKKKAAIFFGIEALAWGLYLNWNGKGDDIEDEFRLTADDEWAVQDYLNWRNSTISRNSSITHALPCSTEVTEGRFGECDSRETQQYYELLGKYDQFIAGWKDAVDRDGIGVQPTQIDSAENFFSANRIAYEQRRDDSNKKLKRASTMAGLILVNHVISAIDAARMTRVKAEDRARLAKRTRFLFALQSREGEQIPMLMAYKPFY
ncbi:MAG: hypothetical protein GKR89_32345 [Candidatus Latescibacteria bacterium]|nr:hypothetical protein [Candidatus Latescibacterota bacterium]